MLSYNKLIMLAELEYARLKGVVEDEPNTGVSIGIQMELPSDQIHALAHAMLEVVEDELDGIRDSIQELQDRVGDIEWNQANPSGDFDYEDQ